MSAPAITPPIETSAEVAAEFDGLLAQAAQMRRDQHGRWCTRDVYGCWQPHGSYDAALSVLDREEIG